MKNYIIANWKLNPATYKQSKRILRDYPKTAPLGAEIVVCPPDVFLKGVVGQFKNRFHWGAQDCFWEDRGAYTGGVSPAELKNSGAEYVIVGHSERREVWSETDEIINKKIKALIKAGLAPILCVGGGMEARKRKLKITLLIGRQLNNDLKGISLSALKKTGMIIAYEPVWAIGTGRPASASYAGEIAELIRKNLDKKYGAKFSKSTPLIYGGSVTGPIAAEMKQQPGINGFLVGGASLNPKEFSKIVKILK